MKKLWLCTLTLFLITSTCCGLSLEERNALRWRNFAKMEEEVSLERQTDEMAFKPTATWSGRLILPKASERRPDGGVYMELHNWDRTVLPVEGEQVVALVWPNMPFGTKGFDVQFSERVYSFLEGRTPTEAKFPAPWRLNGMKSVSALESLAGHRPEDDVVVALKSVKVVPDDTAPSGIKLEISQEPVQISGSHYALLRFLGRNDDGSLSATPWSTSLQDFGEDTVRVFLPDNVPLTVNDDPVRQLPQSSVDEIWNSPLNYEGWYAYGHFDSGRFFLEALEPRSVMRLQATEVVQGRKASRRFVEHEFWKESSLANFQQSFRSVLLQPDGTESSQSCLTSMDEHGSFLVLNLFGWWGRNGKAEREQALRTGHFSIGFADVTICPFTNERRLNIEYKQVYGLNNEDIIGGSMSWSHYNGNLLRGWMYLRPNADVLVDFPSLTQPYVLQGREVSVRRVLEDSLERVMAAYRTGAGVGVSVISELSSCAQDSTQGTFLAFASIFSAHSEPWSASKKYSGLEKLRQWAEDENNYAATAQRWRTLREFYGYPSAGKQRGLSGEFFRVPWPTGGERVWRDDWLVNLTNRESFQFPQAKNNAFSVLDAYAASRNSILPRRTFDTFCKLFLDHNVPLLMVQTVQIGGKYDGLFPLSPEKLNWAKLRGLVKSGTAMLFHK